MISFFVLTAVKIRPAASKKSDGEQRAQAAFTYAKITSLSRMQPQAVPQANKFI